MKLIKASSPWSTLLLLAFVTASHSESQDDQDDIESITITSSASLIGFGGAHANNTIALEAIEKANPASDVLNLINRLPGINVTQGDAIGGNDYSTRVYIRGMSNSRNTAQIGYMIDNMPNGDAFYGGGQKPNRFIDSENVLQVNVGQNASDISSASNTALGGTIRYYSDDPKQNFALRTALTAGADKLARQYVRLDSGEFAPGWSAYLSYSNTNSNSWIRAGSGQFKRRHGDFKLLAELDSGLTLDLRASYNFRDEDDYDSVTLAEFNADPRWDGLYDEFDFATVAHYRRGWGGTRWDTSYSLQVSQEWDNGVRFTATPYYHRQFGFGWWTPPYQVASVDGNVESATPGPLEFFQDTFARDSRGGLVAKTTDISAYPCLTQWYQSDVIDYALNASFSCAQAERIATRRQSLYRGDRTGITSELEITLGSHLLTLGGWFEQHDRDNGSYWFDLDANAPDTIRPQLSDLHWVNYDRTFSTDSTRLYIQDTYHAENWTVIAGLVSHKVSSTYLSRLEQIDRSQSNHKFLPKLGGVYRFNQTQQVFASYSKNIRHLRDGTLTAGETDLLTPELSDNLDFGYRWARDDMAVVTQVFYQRFTDRLGERDAISAGEDMFLQDQVDLINIGGVNNYGAELALSYDMAPNLQLFTSYSYLNSEYRQDISAEQIKKGNKLINTAQDQIFTELDWRPDYFDDKLNVAINVKYVGQRQGNIANTERLDGYRIWGMSANYHIGAVSGLSNVRLQLIGQNINDEEYLAAPDGDSGGRYFIGAARSFSVTLAAEF